MATATPTFAKYDFLTRLGVKEVNQGVYHKECTAHGKKIPSINPATGEVICYIQEASAEDYDQAVQLMNEAQKSWKQTPAPVRGEIVRKIGQAMRDHLIDLGAVVSLEMGKIKAEGVGEIQEIVDICDLAVGLSRQLEGKVIQSERPNHTLIEAWNPLGNVGIISAFNFPAAVMGWNLMLSMICGNCSLWKGAESTSLVSVTISRIIKKVLQENNVHPGVFVLVQGDRSIGELISKDHRINLVSFTGSTGVGRIVGQTVQGRFGKALLELGGNNASVIMGDANLELAVRASVFGAVGTCGQRCTSLRRLIIHESVYDNVKEHMIKAYSTVVIGDPLKDGVLCGPLHNQGAVKRYTDAIEEIKKQGGKILCGGKALTDRPGFFVEPTMVEIDNLEKCPIVKEEVFAPILYLIKFKTLEEAIEINNNVPQGLSSSLFSTNMQNVFKWIGPLGSDCGLVNVNAGTSGAEIGGAFGGEKETGGGRESGSDSWKQYMRRSTCTINYGDSVPLAQGIKFE